MLGTFKGAVPKLTALDMISFVANKGTGFSVDTAVLTIDTLKASIVAPINTGSLSFGASLQVAVVTDLTNSILIWKDGIDSHDSLAGVLGSNLMTGYNFIRNINGGNGTTGIDSNNKQMKESFELVGTKDVKNGISIDGAALSSTTPTFKTHNEMIDIVWDTGGFDAVKTALKDSMNTNTLSMDETVDPAIPFTDRRHEISFDSDGLKASFNDLIGKMRVPLQTKFNNFSLITGNKITYNAKTNYIEFSNGVQTVGELMTMLDEIIAAGATSVLMTEEHLNKFQALDTEFFNKNSLKGFLTASDLQTGWVERDTLVANAAALSSTTKLPMKIVHKGTDKSKVTVKQILTTDVANLFEIRKNSSATDTSFSKTVSMDEFFSNLAVADRSFLLSSGCEEARKVFFIGLLFGDDSNKQSRIASVNLIPNFSLSFVSGAQTLKGFAFSAIDLRVDSPILHMIQDFFADATMSVIHPHYIPVDADYGDVSATTARGGEINSTFSKVLAAKHDASIDEALETINKNINSDKVLSTKQAKALSSDTFGNQWLSKNGSMSVNFTLSAPVLSFIKGFSLKGQMIGSKFLFGAGVLSVYQGIELI